ncbi:MAG: ABC transporter ATP-binding protein [Spirochaetales bacterium]|nr:ABC transporter ATP-binding protein [Spirochaetales bacterium]MCF7938208.1 ABC transporter ATP-binding protein [Spirochaetales bacterium]
MIEVNDLGKSYGSFEAVRHVSFSVSAGQVVGLLGPNGAGKTTIMKSLTGYHFPSYGSVKIGGIDVVEDPLAVKRMIGYLPENVPLYMDLLVSEYLDFMAESRGITGVRKKERTEAAIEATGVTPVYSSRIDKISKGFRQRLGLAQAIIHEPEILIFDEPTTGLDPNQIIEIRNLLKHLGKERTVILSTHILQEVEAVCNQVFILNKGQIAGQGTTEEIERELRGETVLSVTFTGGNSQRLDKELEKLKAVNSVSEVSSEQGDRVSCRISMQPDTDAGELIFDWAVENDRKIVSMVPRHLSLEDIFIQLTREGGSSNA